MTRLDVLTEQATFDPLSDEDYRQMFRSIRGYYRSPEGDEEWELSYGDFTREVGMEYNSKAEWNRWYRKERGYGTTKPLPREYRNAIRRLYVRDGKRIYPDLPGTVAEVIAQNVLLDARVSKYGDGPADEVILLTGLRGSVTLSVDSEVSLYQNGTEGAVPNGTEARRGHRELFRPALPTDYKGRVAATGKSTAELLDFAIRMHEQSAWW